jgi:DNA polymerase-4
MGGVTTTDGRWVLHVDLDEFLVAVERLRRPELVGLPVIVGGRGDPTERAVVSTASYEAREHGVGSGMPLRVAVRKCPDAVLLPVDRPVYEDASARVMQVLKDVPSAVVEVLGWDEAFVGVRTDDPEATAREVQRAVLEATALHCSVGIGDTLVRAKIATDFGKPRGVFRLTRETWLEVMGRLGRGGGRAWPDDTPWVARAHGHETTYQRDLDPAEVPDALRVLAEQVVADLRREERAAMRVHLKVRVKPFFTSTKVRKLPTPTYDAATIAATALELYLALDDDRPVRLLGIRGEMVPPEGGY